MDGRHIPREGPALFVFVVVLVSGAAVLQLARLYLGLGPHPGNALFVALPIVAVLVASRHAKEWT